MNCKASTSAATLLAAVSFVAGCRLPEIAPAGEPENVAAAGGRAIAALAEEGFAIWERGAAAPIARVAPPAGSDRIDEVAIDGTLLFALDALEPGALSVFSLADPRAPRLVDGPREVPVGPFSGVAAAHGVVVVSGGTSDLTIHHYDRDGRLQEKVVSLDLGRGQPDVSVRDDGRLAVVSSHFSFLADTFGFTTLALDAGGAMALARIEIDGAGYSPGVARPANFSIATALSGTTLVVTAGRALAFFDLADPAAPRALATLACRFFPIAVAFAGGRVVAVGSSPEPTIAWVDATHPAQPLLLAEQPLPAGAQPTGVALVGDAAAVAARGAGLLWIDAPSR